MNTDMSGLAAFSLGQLQDAITICRIMRDCEISGEDVAVYISNRLASMFGETNEALADAERPQCPACKNQRLHLRPICAPRGPQNRNGWKSQWYCPGEDCAYEEYSSMAINEQIEKYRRS